MPAARDIGERRVEATGFGTHEKRLTGYVSVSRRGVSPERSNWIAILAGFAGRRGAGIAGGGAHLELQ
jgi:hypothetical protein